MAAAERRGRPLYTRRVTKNDDLFWVTARAGDRFGAWDLGESLNRIEILIFSYSNVDFDPRAAGGQAPPHPPETCWGGLKPPPDPPDYTSGAI